MGFVSNMAGRGGLGYGGEGKWVRRRFALFDSDGEGVFSQACGRAEIGGVGIEYAVIEGPRSEGGSVWVCGTDAVGGGEARRGEDVRVGLGFTGSGKYG